MNIKGADIPDAAWWAYQKAIDDCKSPQDALADFLNAWPGAEHLAASSINIAGSNVYISERINLPVVRKPT